jgi:uncharacterized membrane protein
LACVALTVVDLAWGTTRSVIVSALSVWAVPSFF